MHRGSSLIMRHNPLGPSRRLIRLYYGPQGEGGSLYERGPPVLETPLWRTFALQHPRSLSHSVSVSFSLSFFLALYLFLALTLAFFLSVAIIRGQESPLELRHLVCPRLGQQGHQRCVAPSLSVAQRCESVTSLQVRACARS